MVQICLRHLVLFVSAFSGVYLRWDVFEMRSLIERFEGSHLFCRNNIYLLLYLSISLLEIKSLLL